MRVGVIMGAVVPSLVAGTIALSMTAGQAPAETRIVERVVSEEPVAEISPEPATAEQEEPVAPQEPTSEPTAQEPTSKPVEERVAIVEQDVTELDSRVAELEAQPTTAAPAPAPAPEPTVAEQPIETWAEIARVSMNREAVATSGVFEYGGRERVRLTVSYPSEVAAYGVWVRLCTASDGCLEDWRPVQAGTHELRIPKAGKYALAVKIGTTGLDVTVVVENLAEVVAGD